MRTGPILAVLLLLATPAGAAPPDSAPRTVVRGGRALADALAVATRPAWEDPSAPGAVAIVLDATPNTRGRTAEIRDAVESLGERISHLSSSFRIGRLGGKLSPAARHPSRLAIDVPGLLDPDTEEVNTIRALSRTLADFDDRGGIVVYLADWRFEDDQGLEPFIGRLRGRSQTLSVIGSEAAFGRPWTDPFQNGVNLDPDDRYLPGVGRDPFSGRDPEAPWHGGDTAFPHLPWIYGPMPWRTTFAAGADLLDRRPAARPEDLAERIRRAREGTSSFAYPLASAWGPYGLMRATAETGGHYYLYSFNPKGRSDVQYDYSRVNLFPPDLRPRHEILGDVRRHPLVSALARAWAAVAGRDCGLVRTTGAVTGAGSPQDMEWIEGESLGLLFRAESDRDTFLRRAAEWLARADEAIRALDRGLAAKGVAPSYARYRADAELFRHVLHCLRFDLAEAVAVARGIPADEIANGESATLLVPRTWLAEERDPEKVRPEPGVEPRDPEAGKEVLEARRAHLRRFGGTPFGEFVARNCVYTFRLRRVRTLASARGTPPGLTPSESGSDPDSTPRPHPTPGGSSGGGPATGR